MACRDIGVHFDGCVVMVVGEVLELGRAAVQLSLSSPSSSQQREEPDWRAGGGGGVSSSCSSSSCGGLCLSLFVGFLTCIIIIEWRVSDYCTVITYIINLL